MGVWKRACLYVTRKWVRSILLFVVFFVMELFLLTGLMMREGAKKAVDDTRHTFTTGLTIDWIMMPNAYDFLDEHINEKGELVMKIKLPFVKKEHIKELLAIDGVTGFYAKTQQVEAYTGLTVKPGHHAWLLDFLDGKYSEEYEGERESLEEFRGPSETEAHYNRFIPVYDSEWHPAFVNGALELVEGRHVRLGDEGKAVISDVVAQANGLKPGDKVKAQNSDIFTGELYGSIYETEIVGIYHVNFEQEITKWTYEDDILANTLFCAPGIEYWSRYENQIYTGADIIAEESEYNIGSMVLFVEDPMLLDSVKEKLLAFDAVDWKYYNIGSYDKDYKDALKPLFTVKKLSGVLIAVITSGALVILFLIFTMWMRSRRYEMDIFSSVGITKKNMLLQCMLECFCIGLLAFLAAVLLAGPVSEMMGNGLQAYLSSKSSPDAYEVTFQQGTQALEVDRLPAKGGHLAYEITPGKIIAVFLVMAQTSAVSVCIAFLRMFQARPHRQRHN